MQQHVIPPYCRFTIRSDSEFAVYDTDAGGKPLRYIGPDDSSRRTLTLETADNQRIISVKAKASAMVTVDAEVRPSPFEANSGIPSELSQPVHQPTIQEMIRQYIREAMPHPDDTAEETPDEFFDFDMDTDHDLLVSEYEEMDEEPTYDPDSLAGSPEKPSDNLPAEPGPEGTAEPERAPDSPSGADAPSSTPA